MNKERLEELKKIRLLYEVCFVDEYASAIDDVTADFDLLIKRVQELEKELTYYKMATESYLDMEQQNKRYRERLEYLLEEAKDHKRKGLRIQHWALIKDLEDALKEDENE